MVTYVCAQDEADKLIVVERGDLVFVFNFHPVNSYTDYRVGALLPGPYKVASAYHALIEVCPMSVRHALWQMLEAFPDRALGTSAICKDWSWEPLESCQGEPETLYRW